MKVSAIKFSSYILLIIVLLASLSSCKNNEKALRKGNYNDVISKSVSKLQKNKKKDKYILLLEEAYAKANERDLNRIDYLKRTGDPASYLEIADNYIVLDRRQKKVQPLLPLYLENGKQATFAQRKYNSEIVYYRDHAADFYYYQAMKLLDENDKFSAREAYGLLSKIKSFHPGFRDTKAQLARADAFGSNKVLVRIKNNSPYHVSASVLRELEQLDVQQFDQLWADFDYQERPGVDYDFLVVMHVNFAEAGPEQVREQIFNRTKKIRVGWEGSDSVSDSTRENSRVAVYETVEAEVIQTNLHKEASIRGHIDFLDVRSERIIGSWPLETNALFDYNFSIVRGDHRAMTDEDKELCEVRPAPFPTNQQMLIDAARDIKSKLRSIIRNNDELVLR